MSVFLNAFYFSVHTLTTVGYGNVYPRGAWTNAVSALEASYRPDGFRLGHRLLVRALSQAARAKILFSSQAIIAPYQDGTSLQFRIINARSNVLMDMDARVLLMTVDSSDGRAQTQLLRPSAGTPRRLLLSADLDHRASHRFGQPAVRKNRAGSGAGEAAEFLILIQGFDDTFSQLVHARYSYRHDEMIWGAKFVPAFKVDPKGDLVVEVDRIHELRVLG